MARVILVLGFAGATLGGLLETAPSSSVIIIVPVTVLVLKDCVHVRMGTAETIAVFSHASMDVLEMARATMALALAIFSMSGRIALHTKGICWPAPEIALGAELA